MDQPHQYPRRILLAVTGLSPQVVTETLYAMCVACEAPFVPTEVHLLTTSEGAERARLTLLSADPGWFHRLRRDYALPPIDFPRENIHVIEDAAGRPLEDIRRAGDNTSAADAITEQVRRFTSDSESALHVSIAGGRKTMSFLAGYALSLYARPQDRLSHVLVSTPFESNQNFFYPTTASHVIYTHPPENRPVDARNASVSLAEIPFVRLRHGLPESLLAGRAGYSETVAAAQRSLGPPEVTVDPRSREVTCGGFRVRMAPADLAFYAWFARQRAGGFGPLHWTQRRAGEDLLRDYARIEPAMSLRYQRMEEALAHGMTKDYFDQRKSKTNAALKRALGPAACQPYLIRRLPARPYSGFALEGLEPSAIHIAGEPAAGPAASLRKSTGESLPRTVAMSKAARPPAADHD